MTKTVISFIVIILLSFGCERSRGTDKNKIVLINNFYDNYGYVLSKRSSESKKTYSKKLDSVQYYWCEILKNKKEVKKELLNLKTDNLTDSYLYSSKYNKMLKSYAKYPINVHILYWLKSMEEEDFLFNRRERNSDKVCYHILNSPVSTIPIFTKSNYKKILNYDGSSITSMEFKNLRSDFIVYNLEGNSSEYLLKVDSVLNILRANNEVSLTSMNLNWSDFRGKILVDSTKNKFSIFKNCGN